MSGGLGVDRRDRHGFRDLDAVDTGRRDAACVARAFAGRIEAIDVEALESSPRVMRSGDEVRVDPVMTASIMS